MFSVLHDSKQQNSNMSSVSLQINVLIQIFNFALFVFYKQLSIKGEILFLNESNIQQKLQKTEQWMQIDPEGALKKMSSCKQNWLPTKKKTCCIVNLD